VDNLFLDPQFVYQHPLSLISRKAMLGDSPSSIICDALAKSYADDRVTPNEAGMECVVEGTPGACLFMTLVEILARRRELLNATLQASGHMHRTKCDMPAVVLLDAPSFTSNSGSVPKLFAA